MLFMTSPEIEHPDLALRLLSVRDTFQMENDRQGTDRKTLIALCLINVSRNNKSANDATNMVNRALCILPYDVTDTELSMDNLRILENQIGDNHMVGGDMFVIISKGRSMRLPRLKETLMQIHF